MVHEDGQRVVPSFGQALRPSASIEDRLSAPLAVAPELCFCNMGSMNFGAYAMKEKYQGKWRYDWEEDYLETSRGAIIEGLTREIAPPTEFAPCSGSRRPLRRISEPSRNVRSRL